MKAEYYRQSLIIEDSKNANRFKEDCISFESDKYMIKTFGYFLNMQECLKRFSCVTPVECICTMIEQGVQLSTQLYGCYLIVALDKSNNRLYVYNDLLSKHSLYYYYEEKSHKLIFSDSFFGTLQSIKQNQLPYTIDNLGVKMMIWHRMFYDNLTYINEIKFLRPFEYIEVNDGKMMLRSIPTPKIIDVSLEDAASQINQLFTKAVKSQYQKNEAHGYPQIITLSGGMDSRSTFLYGLANGYAEQTGYCYGESTSVDYDYAQQLATKHNCKLFFHSIDKGNFLLEREEICNANEAQMVYSGPSGLYDSLRFYNTNQWGLVHTGLGGGEIMGDMRVAEKPTKTERLIESLKYKFGKGKKDRSWGSFVNSLRCTDDELQRIEEIKKHYSDFNLFQSLNDMRRCLNAQKMAQSFGIEYTSPFLYEDFFLYMLQIPYYLTKDRQLYLYWQKKYNPQQFATPSTFQMGCRPGNKAGYYAKRFYKYVVNKMGRKTKHDMVPIEQWMAINPKIGEAQQTWFTTDMACIDNKVDTSLSQLIHNVWASGSAPRPNILTATWALKKIIE